LLVRAWGTLPSMTTSIVVRLALPARCAVRIAVTVDTGEPIEVLRRSVVGPHEALTVAPEEGEPGTEGEAG
jgi:hypothetical protein